MTEGLPMPASRRRRPVLCGRAVATVTTARERARRRWSTRSGAARADREVPPEIADAQDSLERRIRAHLAAAGRRHADRQPLHDDLGAPRARRRSKRYEVRLHHMFADADPVITRALAHYIAENDAERRACSATSSTRTPGTSAAARAAQPTQVIFTAGEHHDLRAIYDEINARYFEDKIDAAITWGAAHRPAAPPQLDQDGQLLGRGSADPDPPLARSRVRAAVLRRVDRVPRDAPSGSRHPREERPPRVPLQGVPGRRGACSSTTTQAKSWERRHLDALLTY